jgi:hypothetical protein
LARAGNVLGTKKVQEERKMTLRYFGNKSLALKVFGTQFPSRTNLKTIMLSLYVLAALIPTANAWLEFGRHPDNGSLFRRHRILRPEQVRDEKFDQQRQNEVDRIMLE